MKLFNEITQKVGEWHGENTVWIAQHFGPLMEAAESAKGLARLLDHFKVEESNLFDAGLAGSKHKVNEKVSALQMEAAANRDNFERYTRARHAGNYQMRAAEEAVTGSEFRSGVQKVEESLDSWQKNAGTILKRAGAAGSVIDVTSSLLEGDSYGEVIAGGAGSAAGAAAGAKAGARGGVFCQVESSHFSAKNPATWAHFPAISARSQKLSRSAFKNRVKTPFLVGLRLSLRHSPRWPQDSCPANS